MKTLTLFQTRVCRPARCEIEYVLQQLPFEKDRGEFFMSLRASVRECVSVPLAARLPSDEGSAPRLAAAILCCRAGVVPV